MREIIAVTPIRRVSRRVIQGRCIGGSMGARGIRSVGGVVIIVKTRVILLVVTRRSTVTNKDAKKMEGKTKKHENDRFLSELSQKNVIKQLFISGSTWLGACNL